MGQDQAKATGTTRPRRLSPNPLSTSNTSQAGNRARPPRPTRGKTSAAATTANAPQRTHEKPMLAKPPPPPRPQLSSDLPSDEDEGELDEAALRAQQAANAAAVDAQLAAVHKLLGEGSLGLEDGEAEDDVGSGIVPELTPPAQRRVRDNVVLDPEESIGEVSLHSSDFADEELLQGLRDLDDELEDDYQRQVEDLQEQIASHKHEAVRLLREEGDRPAAAAALQTAKRLEETLAALTRDHVPPVSVRMEALAADMTPLEDAVAAKKQEALAALRAGEKPTALEMMKEAKQMEKQLEGLKEQYAELAKEKEALLHSKG